MLVIHTRPSYVAVPALSTMQRKPIPGRFVILEYRDGEVSQICELSNQGDRLNNLLKRGIPLDDARNLFYQMDGVKL